MGTLYIKKETGIIGSNQRLLDIVSKEDIRELLRSELIEGAVQNELFIDIGLFDALFNELRELIAQSKPLYNRWVQKVDDKERRLSVPKKPLKLLLEQYVNPFVKGKKSHDCCHGGEIGWSTRKSIESHLPVSCMFSFDLSNAFNSISIGHVYPFFYDLFNEIPKEYRADITWLLSILSTVSHEGDRVLPQGSPVAMALFNRILYPIDKFIDKNTKKKGMKFSRWVDDFNLSSPTPRNLEEFLGSLKSVEEHFQISRTKIYFQDSFPIYVDGQVITKEGVKKNSKEERKNMKVGNVDYSHIQKMQYFSWFE